MICMVRFWCRTDQPHRRHHGIISKKVKKGSFYIAQYPVKRSFLYSAVSSPLDRSKRFTLFASPDRPVHSDTNSASPGSILARQQLHAKTKSLTCPPLSTARYSFIQLSQLGQQWRERKCPIFETVAKEDSNPGSVDCESGILPLSYRAPRSLVVLVGLLQLLWYIRARC